MVAKIVIGLNYGDEGKGLVTDYLTNDARKKGHDVINVLSNGSCQRGHTVELADGTRHVFHHFGSGTFAGAETYFPKDFLVNPVIFNMEKKEIENYNPIAWCHPECTIVTPYHIALNQEKEKYRGVARHGSCGMGVWEACRYNSFKVADLYDKGIAEVRRKIKRIRSSIKSELCDFGISDFKFYDSEDLLDRFTLDCCHFAENMGLTYDDVIEDFDTVIFENGQGLMLDKNLTDKDYLTPSNTGLTNPKNILKGLDVDDVETIYVTRSYITRHGPGPLPMECKKEDINPLIVDPTNVPNEWQGSLRYAHMDWSAAKNRIERFGKTSLAITHINEYTPDVPDLNIDCIYWFDGTTRKNVKISC